MIGAEESLSNRVSSPFSTNMAISETKGQGWRAIPGPSEVQRCINLNPGRLFVQQPPKNGKGSRGSFKLLRYRLQQRNRDWDEADSLTDRNNREMIVNCI